MGRWTTNSLIGLGTVALSFGLAACAADGEWSDGGGDGGSGGLVSGATGGAVGATGGAVGATGGAVGATGGAVGSGGTTGVAVACTGTGFGFEAGYVDTGTLCGYGWTADFATGLETKEPPCGTGACFEDAASFCMSGTIGQGTEWDEGPPVEPGIHPGLMLGFNVAESKDGTGSGSYTATGTGLTVNYTFNATGGTPSGQRVVVSVGATEYCADATSGMAIPWSGFTVGCWEAGGAALAAGAAITKIGVQVLGSYEADLTVSDFCITGATVN